MVTLSEYIKELRSKGRACFTKSEALKEIGISNANLNARIQRAKRKGELISPARNFYVIVTPKFYARSPTSSRLGNYAYEALKDRLLCLFIKCCSAVWSCPSKTNDISGYGQRKNEKTSIWFSRNKFSL